MDLNTQTDKLPFKNNIEIHQQHLSPQKIITDIDFEIQQIKQAIHRNDGTFLNLIHDLELNLQNLLKELN
jgi:hypothetical protein